MISTKKTTQVNIISITTVDDATKANMGQGQGGGIYADGLRIRIQMFKNYIQIRREYHNRYIANVSHTL